jgi:hypothetical protein
MEGLRERGFPCRDQVNTLVNAGRGQSTASFMG